MDRELLSYKGAKLLFVLAGLLTFVQGLCTIVQAVLLGGIVSDLFFGGQISDIGSRALLFFVVVAARYGCVLAIRQLSGRFADQTSAHLRMQFLTRLFERGPKLIRRKGTGNLVTLALEGVAQVRNYLERFVPKMLANGVLPLMILIYVFTQDLMSALILFFTVPVLIVFMILLGLAAQTKMEKRWASYRVLANHFLDSLHGLPTLRYLGISRTHERTIARVSDRYRSMTMGTLRVAFLSSFALDFFTMLSIAFVAVFLGIRLINGAIALEPALIILILAPEYFAPIRALGQDYHATLDGREAAKKMNAFIRSDVERPAETGTRVDRWSDHAVLNLEHVAVRYDVEDREEALVDLNFQARGYEKIGIVGASGAGKSTLIDLIGGFIGQEDGVISLNGRPLNMKSDGWRRQITYIPQHPYLFSATLRDNIAFYAPKATDEAIREAIRKAGLSDLAAQLPNGLDEKIGAGGRALSGGQEQRIAVARALLCNRPILLLDEPTAHLDIETEYELKETMLQLFKGKLVLMATHRLHWMTQMDRIVVIDHGRIVESGSQEALMARAGTYHQLVAAQMEGVR